MGVTPLMVLALLIFVIIGWKPFYLDNYTYPVGIQIMGQLIAIVPILLIVGCFLFKYCYDGGWIVSLWTVYFHLRDLQESESMVQFFHSFYGNYRSL